MILLLFTLLAGTAFSKESKHEGGDLLLGIGEGFTPNILLIFSDTIPKENYAIAFDFGLNVDFYVSKWLSVNSGIFLRPGVYLLLDNEVTSFSDWAKSPISLSIPIMAHMNIPVVDFLYFGAGIAVNFPIISMWESELRGVDSKGGPFLGIPLDFGFDFISAGKGGSRLFFRVTPEIHRGGKTLVLLGLMWQIYNFKLK